MNRVLFVLFILIIINIGTFLAYYADKRRAERGDLRISELTLLSMAFFGGGLGAFLGMRLCHHKTKKWKFRILVPFFLILQIVILILGFRYL